MGDDERMQFVEDVRCQLDCDDFMKVVDEYIALSNHMKKRTRGRQYLLSPLVVDIGEKRIFVKQTVCKLKMKKNANSNELLQRIKTLFVVKDISRRLDDEIIASEGCLDKETNHEMDKVYKLKPFPSNLIKLGTMHDQKRPLWRALSV